MNRITSNAPRVAALPIMLKTDEVAEMLGVAPRTLEDWRCRGGGPPYVSVSRRCVRYRLRDVETWLEARNRTSTSAPLAA